MDYQVTNALRKERALSKKRGEVLVLSPERALDALLGANEPARLIQSFPEQDLYYLMHHIGPEDFLPVLALATSAQWEYFLDMDVWQGDRIDLPAMTRTLQMLFKADAPRLLRWAIMEKPDFLEYYFFRHMEIRIREHDEDPSSFGDDFTSLDQQFYFRFPEIPADVKAEIKDLALVGDAADADPAGELEKNRERAEELITGMLNTLAQMDLSVCQGVLLESAAVIPAETEEEQYRLRNVRLAEKGFMPHYEAAGVYQPLDRSALSRRPAAWLRPLQDMPLHPAPGFTQTVLPRESLFGRSLHGVSPSLVPALQLEFAALVNQVVSADQLRIQCREDLDGVVRKTAGFLSVGLEVIHGWKEPCQPRHGAALLQAHPLCEIFRVGSGAGIRLKTVAEKWHKNSWLAGQGLSLTFLGEQWLGVVGGLLLKRPLYFDNYTSGLLYRPFDRLAQMEETARVLSAVQDVDALMAALQFKIPADAGEYITWETVVLTLWARSCTDLPLVVAPVSLDAFQPFFARLFSRHDTGAQDRIRHNDFMQWLAEATGQPGLCQRLGDVFTRLFAHLDDDLGAVDARDIDPRLMLPYFLVK